MKLRWVACAAVLSLATCVTSAPGADTEGPPADLAAVRQAFEANVALGDALAGQPAKPEQAAEAERLFEEALAGARAYLRLHSREAEAHRLAGQILCTSYRSVEVPAPDASAAGEEADQTVTTLARGSVSGCEEGLAEFRAALRLDKSNLDCVLDYAEAMLHCDDLAGCTQQCISLWGNRTKMSRSQSARCASLLAASARRVNRPQEEVRWLTEAARLDPQNEACAARLAELLAEQPGVVWLSFEVGQSVAARLKKPMFVHFTADWCGWCRKLEQETFPAAKVVALLQQCVCVKVNGDRRRDLTSRYGVSGYPTGLVLHPSGHELHRMVGFRPADAFAAQLERVLAIDIN